jgi:twitching motility protein PilI
MHEASDSARTPGELLGMLAELEQQFQESARNLPELEISENRWQGLAFQVAGVRVVSAMVELSEMLPYPGMITRVPGARDWIVGIANVRGTLLPITDLQAYLGTKRLVPGKSSRVLVVRHGQILTGLLVPAAFGMKQFDLEQHMPNARMQGPVGAYVHEAFQVEREIWPVFSLRSLVSDPRFIAGAA